MSAIRVASGFGITVNDMDVLSQLERLGTIRRVTQSAPAEDVVVPMYEARPGLSLQGLADICSGVMLGLDSPEMVEFNL